MKKKYLRNLILFILIIVLTFYIILKDQDITEIIKALSSIDLKYILIAIIGMCIYFICEAINIGRTLKALGEKSTFYRNIKYALIGFFFSSVTPAASGGQPMQVYYMNKDKISVANSTLALLINLTSMQIVTISIAIISLFFNYEYMNWVLIWLFILGIFLNASALTLLLVSIFSKKMTNGLINIVIKILKVFKVKNIEGKKEKLENELSKYQASATYIKTNKRVIVRTLLTTYIQFLVYYSISYWVYRSFGLKEYNILQILSMQSVLFATVSGIPSPGAVGVSEGGFLEIFRNVYSNGMLHEAMLLNRGVNFYLFVLISSVIVMLYTVKDKNKDKGNIEEKMKVIFGTTNQGKIDQVKGFLEYKKINIEFISLKDIGFNEEIIEDGETIEENSLIKAKAIKEFCNKNDINEIIVTDDAGLFVDALDGRPGVHTARYAGDHAPQIECINKLLTELKDIPDEKRGATFVCVLTAILKNGDVVSCRGETRGKIVKTPGSMGKLTYGPVLKPDGLDRVINDLTEEELGLTHRDKAWIELISKLRL